MSRIPQEVPRAHGRRGRRRGRGEPPGRGGAGGRSGSQVTPVAGTPPAFGTAPPVGPEVTAATLAEAEKLVRVELTPAERAQAAGNWRQAMAGDDGAAHGAEEGRPRAVARAGVALGSACSRACPAGPGARPVRPERRPIRARCPKRDEDIAFAPVSALSRWIESRALTSERLTRIYLERHRALRPEAPVRHHADAATSRSSRPGARTRRSRRESTAARSTAFPWGVEGPPRHEGHPDDLGRRAVPRPRAGRRRRRRRAAARRRAPSSSRSSASARSR